MNGACRRADFLGDRQGKSNIFARLGRTFPKRENIGPADIGACCMEGAARDTLLAAIARGRTRLDQLIAGERDVDALAATEWRSTRGVLMTISLAFVSPKIMRAAIAGSLPPGISLTRLYDLPIDWRRQHEALGID